MPTWSGQAVFWLFLRQGGNELDVAVKLSTAIFKKTSTNRPAEGQKEVGRQNIVVYDLLLKQRVQHMSQLGDLDTTKTQQHATMHASLKCMLRLINRHLMI